MPDQQSSQNDELNIQQLLHQLTLTLQNHNVNSTNTTSSTDHGSKVRLREPDTFTGDNCDQQVVDGWIRSIERHRNFHGWNPERTVAFAITFLKNHADTWYRTLEENDIAPTHWTEFKNIFIAKFRPGNAYDLARDRLVNLRQTTTIQEYIKQFANTIILIPELHRLEAYDRFMRGLKVEHDQLFAELRAVDVDLRTIDLAYNKASACEASHVRRDSRSRVISSPVRPGHVSINQDDDPMDLDAIIQRGGSNYPSNNNNNNQSSSWRPNKNNNNTSNYNNYNGNNGRPPRRRTGNNNYNNNNGGSGGSGYPPCRLCAKSGHSAANCHLLSVVISAVNNAKYAPQRSAVNYMQTTSDATSDNSNGSIFIENKNDTSNNYSHMSSFFNNNNSSSLSIPIIAAADSVIKTVNNAVVSSPSTLLSTVSNSTDIGCSPNYPMELVPVIKTSSIGQHYELNYVLELNSLSTALPLYHGVTGPSNTVIKVLIDNGASDNYVSASLADSIAFNMNGVSRREVETADGGVTIINREAMLELNLGGYDCQVSAFVFPTKFDLILGRTWLKEHSPKPNWNSESWTLGNGNNSIRLMPIHATGNNLDNFVSGDDAPTPRPKLNYLISKKQVNNCLRDGGSGFLLYMTDSLVSIPTTSNDALSENKTDDAWIASFLNEFSSVFSEKLPGLPQDIGFQHVINLNPDAKPVNRTPYKMSPAELDELQKQLKELLELNLVRLM